MQLIRKDLVYLEQLAHITLVHLTQSWNDEETPEEELESEGRFDRWQEIAGTNEAGNLTKYSIELYKELNTDSIDKEVQELSRAMFDKLYKTGAEDNIKSPIVFLESQILNTKLTENHYRFIRDFCKLLLTDGIHEKTDDLAAEIAKHYGLNIFRGIFGE